MLAGANGLSENVSVPKATVADGSSNCVTRILVKVNEPWHPEQPSIPSTPIATSAGTRRLNRTYHGPALVSRFTVNDTSFSLGKTSP